MLMIRLKIDDPLDAFAVHGACGFWGVISTGLFGNPDTTGGNGVFHGGDQLGVQIVGALIIALWVSVLSIPAFLCLKRVGWLRLSDTIQEMGVDEHEHSPRKSFSFTTLEEEATPECTPSKDFAVEQLEEGCTPLSKVAIEAVGATEGTTKVLI